MPGKCMAPFCQSHLANPRSVELFKERKLSFHRLPLRWASLLAQWMRNMKDAGDERWREHYTCLNKGNPRNYRICSLHFTPDCFEPSTLTPRLKPNAIPTIFNALEDSRVVHSGVVKSGRLTVQHDHTYALGDADSIKQRLVHMYDKLRATNLGKSNNHAKVKKLTAQLNETKRLLEATNSRLLGLECLNKSLMKIGQDAVTKPAVVKKTKTIATQTRRAKASQFTASTNVKKKMKKVSKSKLRTNERIAASATLLGQEVPTTTELAAAIQHIEQEGSTLHCPVFLF